MARPTKLDDITVKKLEEAFSWGCTVKEACCYANISKQTYYNWTGENQGLLDRFDQLQQFPILKARRTLVEGLEGNPNLALKYLERKLPEEFSSKNDLKGTFLNDDIQKVEITIVRREDL